MSKPLRCWIGLHSWRAYHDPTVETPDAATVECGRCGKLSAKSRNVANRIGWVGHTGS
jgi:hypothetical protein